MTIYGWMRTELGLKGNELMLYALIYSFSQNGQLFSGSREYLSEWVGCSVKTVQRSLDKLTEDGLLVKHKSSRNGKSVCAYATSSCMDKMSTHEWTKCPSMKDKMSLNNNIYIKRNRYISISSRKEFPEHESEYIEQNMDPSELEELLELG